MAQRTTHRRNLAVGDPKISLDPTRKSHAHPHPRPDPSPTSTPSTTSAAANKPHHPTASSAVRNISNRFSKLYANHKPFASLKPSNPPSHPRVYTNLQAKALTKSAIDDSSLLKSNLQYRRNIEEMKESVRVKATVIDGKEKKFSRVSHGGHDVKMVSLPAKTEEVNKFSKKEREKKEFHEGRDIKRSSNSLARSQDSGLKEYPEGYDMKRPSVSLSISGGRRRSFCSSQIELSDFFSCTGVKVMSVDMPPFMQVHAVDCARKAHDSLEKFTHKSLALTLKKEFDGVYGPAWHCIVGTSFGSFVTHSVGGFLYFSMDHKLYVLLFKTTVQRAD